MRALLPWGAKMMGESASTADRGLASSVDDLAARGVEGHGRVVGARTACPLLSDGPVVDAPIVIWCTGFAQAVRLGRPSEVFGEDGWPREFLGASTDAPGLFFLPASPSSPQRCP